MISNFDLDKFQAEYNLNCKYAKNFIDNKTKPNVDRRKNDNLMFDISQSFSNISDQLSLYETFKVVEFREYI